ncbi:sugar phosphate isomerase/epimerase [Streptomyces tubbatahanensis]|uniref:Sugar phosphate isomerase/epimerase n=1 Tax=Streptomyces tubbatahanensis TaxID=2923272 RepID=A0ABY3XLQ2_9ACTN|nr:sugar phosphate isomerase/epimerase [Streptomyces tubbatahanensis]UNS95334.1 sugar phosphate isomerase/epimerase [Streptomyces tubbatahanensis]
MSTTTTPAGGVTPAAPLSVQLYSVREQLADDLDAALSRLARIGFRHVEPFGLGSPQQPADARMAHARRLRRSLDAAGLGVSTVHAGLPTDLSQLAAECAVLGADTVLVPHPHLVPGFDEDAFTDPARLDAFAGTLTDAAHELAGHGLRLGYHNHWFEWTPLPDGTPAWDRFWDRSRDALVAELDLYWTVTAGADPAHVLAQLGDRAVAVHLKDGPARRDAPQTPIGTGEVDLTAALREAPRGIRWHVAEIDTTDMDVYALLEHNARALVGRGLSRWAR